MKDLFDPVGRISPVTQDEMDDCYGRAPKAHDSGCRVTMALRPGVTGSAIFRGDNREHRLTLERVWGDALALALWIGMNPSGAEADVDDLTVLKEQHWTRMLGFTRYTKVNAGTYRWTDSRSLGNIAVPLAHPDNLPMIRDLAGRAAVIVLATGKPPATLERHVCDLLEALKRDGRTAMCLGATKDGWPKHSSRLAYATPFVDFVL